MTGTDRPLRTIAVACAAMVMVVLVPALLVAAGLPMTGILLFAAVVLLWPLLALGVLALSRLRR